MRISTSAVIATIVFSSGCSVTKNMNEMQDATQKMKDNTQEMSQTTQEMSHNTKEMNDNTRGMRDTTSEMLETTTSLRDTIDATYRVLRQGDAMSARSARLKMMEESRVLDAKISEAAKYFMAFEFQLINDFGTDLNVDTRQQYYLSATLEFLSDLKRYIYKSREVLPSSNNADMQNLYAFSAAVSMINPNEEVLAEKHGWEKISMLTLLEESLKQKSALEQGLITEENIQLYQRAVLTESEDVIYLLRLRANFLAAAALGKIADLNTGGFFDIPGHFRKLRLWMFKWKVDFSKFNTIQIRTYTKWLNQANETRDFLKQIGIEAKINEKMLKVYKNMQFDFKYRNNGTLDSTMYTVTKEFEESVKSFREQK
ncbi:MAG: hypothetical protein AABZ06_00455 [Bdellovibrionota bacterium]